MQFKHANKVISANKCNETYMSITSLIRTLTATSIDGFPLLLLNLDDIVMRLVFGEAVSEQTAAMTSRTSTGFNRKGCCSLIHIKRYCEKREIGGPQPCKLKIYSQLHKHRSNLWIS